MASKDCKSECAVRLHDPLMSNAYVFKLRRRQIYGGGNGYVLIPRRILDASSAAG
jgi:hypothetical protein